MSRHFTILLLLFFTFYGQAQEVWSIEKCVQTAQQNSIDAQQALIGVKQAQLTTKENKFSRMPSFNASTNLQFNFGRTIDFTTNAFRNESGYFNTWNINMNIPLFSGGAIHNSVEQSKYELSRDAISGRALPLIG